MSRLLILGGDEQLVTRLTDMPDMQVISLPAERVETEEFELLRSLDPQSLPDVVFFGSELDVGIALFDAAELDEAYPQVGLVLVGDYSAETVIVAMRSGIRDILHSDATDAEVDEVLRRVENHRAEIAASAPPPPPAMPAPAEVSAMPVPPGSSRIITVISPKGGVGKTSISTNLAIGLAQGHPSSVVLVDLDLQFGDVASTLDLAPQSTIEHALRPDAAADDLVLKTMLTVHANGFFVLCGADSPAANENVTGQQVKRLLDQLSKQFATVVVDTASGLDEATLAALEMTDDVVLVTTMDVACVRAVRKAADLLGELGLLPASRTLALNLADRQSGLKVKDVEGVVGMPVDVVIQRSADVQLAANHGQPLMLRTKKGGPFVKSIHTLMDRLRKQGEVTESKHRRLEVA
jgi:pilus assembly protein CpaE